MAHHLVKTEPSEYSFADSPLVRQGRFSVSPLTEEQAALVMRRGGLR